MTEATGQAALSAIRTLLAVGGSALVARGWTDDATVQQVIGALMVLIPLAWGVWDKYRAERAAAARETSAYAAGAAVATAAPGGGIPVNPAVTDAAAQQPGSLYGAPAPAPTTPPEPTP